MATFENMTIGDNSGYNSMDKVQKIIDGLGTVKGVKKVLLVSEEGFPIISARTLPMSDEVETVVSAMVAGIVSTFSSACIQLNLGDQVDFIHVQTPIGLGIISKVQSTILVLITDANVKLGLMHYLVSSTKMKLLKTRDF
ncbi:MAG: roadblock/LC7 domain-containing protein [Candidatus Hodarchaeales archaeon]|jgi:predicted regulator of Ras-like GTPase activity (Roadblock/LC7/MglB family)